MAVCCTMVRVTKKRGNTVSKISEKKLSVDNSDLGCHGSTEKRGIHTGKYGQRGGRTQDLRVISTTL